VVALASKFFGRWPSGAALVLAPERDDPTVANDNDFGFAGPDPDGFICPIGSHIRRVNPRDSLAMSPPAESMRSANRHRVIRRATFYGERAVSDDLAYGSHAPPGPVADAGPTGLHFFAINADLARQFEFVQQSWSNQAAFNGLVANKDPIVGNNDGSGIMVLQGSPIRARIKAMPRFVTARGGAYFFLPSLTALRFLSRATWT
jgi:deferrochelatase/peroxidase EfeB